MTETGKDTLKHIVAKKPRRKVKKLSQLNMAVFIIAVLVGLGVGAWYLMAPKGEDFILTYYPYAVVQNHDFLVNVTANGTTKPKEETVLRATTDATVSALLVQEGDDVTQGTVLIRLVSDTLNNQLAEAERRVWQAKYDQDKQLIDQAMEVEKQERDLVTLRRQLQEAEEDYTQKAELLALGAIARREVEWAEQIVNDSEYTLDRTERLFADLLQSQQLARQNALEKVEAEQVNLQNLQDIAKSLQVIAPFTGRVIELNVQEGQALTSNAVLLTLADIVDPEIIINVDADMVDLLKPKHEAVIKTALNTYQGQITYISPRAVDTSSGSTVETRLQSVGGVGELRPGTAVTVEIEVGRRTSPFLPRGPYLSSGQQLFVYVLQGDVAVRREVRYGMITSTAVEVLSGLSLGEKVITGSYDEFRHLDQIRVDPEGGHKQ
jgi:HlyD family secretion protein